MLIGTVRFFLPFVLVYVILYFTRWLFLRLSASDYRADLSTGSGALQGSMTGVELMGFDKDSDREALDSILQEVWEDDSWR